MEGKIPETLGHWEDSLTVAHISESHLTSYCHHRYESKRVGHWDKNPTNYSLSVSGKRRWRADAVVRKPDKYELKFNYPYGDHIIYNTNWDMLGSKRR